MQSLKFRLYAVRIHDLTTREAIVPEFEIGILKSAWRGKKIEVTATDSVRELPASGEAMWNSLMTRYSAKHVQAFFSGPERLEVDMNNAADKTTAWLEKSEKYMADQEAALKSRAKAEAEADAKAEAAKAGKK